MRSIRFDANKFVVRLSILRHESVPSRSFLRLQHNRTVLTQNGSGSSNINVCAKTEPPVEHAPHAPASLDFSFPNFPVPEPFFSHYHVDPSMRTLWGTPCSPHVHEIYNTDKIIFLIFCHPPTQVFLISNI